MQLDQLKRREFITLLGGAAAAWPFAVGKRTRSSDLIHHRGCWHGLMTRRSTPEFPSTCSKAQPNPFRWQTTAWILWS
jgi:hypothetical protein